MRNQTLPHEETSASLIERWIGAPLNLIEELGHFLLVMPLNAALRKLDRLSFKLEGTRLREVISHTLFPVTLIVSMWLGFKATEQGASITSIGTLALIPVVYGLFCSPARAAYAVQSELVRRRKRHDGRRHDVHIECVLEWLR